MRSSPVVYHTPPSPGVIQLEDDNSAPLLAPEHMLAMALNAKGAAEARAQEAEMLAGQLCAAVCAMIELLQRNPATSHLVDRDGMVTLPAEVIGRVEGMQIEGVQLPDGDVGIMRRERAPQPIVSQVLRG